MKTWVILLRGINVGGKNKLPMARLRNCLETYGFADIKTYIQSGNVILRSEKALKSNEVKAKIKDAIFNEFGYDISVMILSPKTLNAAMSDNPFGQSFDAPNFMFLFFCQSIPDNPDISGLERLKTKAEKLKLIGDVCYAYAGDGAGRSKMFAKIERSLGVPATARNWRTLKKMKAILEAGYGET